MSSRWRGAAVLSLVLLGAGLAGPAAASAATLYVSTGGSDSASCSQIAPCKSFDRAYRQATPGDIVQVGAGSYPEQNLPALGRPAPKIEFRPAVGAAVTVGGLDIKADNVIVRSMKVAGWVEVDTKDPNDAVEHVELYNIDAKQHWANHVNDFLWKGGSIGPSLNDKVSMIASQPASYNMTYDGILWHDAERTDPNVHMECLYDDGVQGLTIRNSRFTNCSVFDVFITKLGDAMPSDVVLENNVFEHSTNLGSNTTAYAAIALHASVRLNRVTVRNNVWEQGWQADPGTILGGRMSGNIGEAPYDGGCVPQLTYSNNVFTVQKCGASDKVDANAFSEFQNKSAGDWRLKSGATAIDAANPSDSTSTDAAGNGRNGLPDAGAFEYQGTTPTPTPTPTPSPTPTPTPAPDTQAPSVPQGMAWTTKTQTSIGVRWDASTDNVGVTGYRIYRNGTRIATTTSTSYNVTGLTCGTSYTIALGAIDAAGNESNRDEATGTTSTNACATPTPTPTPSPTPTPTPSPTPSPTPTPTPDPCLGLPPLPPICVPVGRAAPAGPVGKWSFDEASGTTVNDASGNGNTGTVSGAKRVTGLHGKALSFDGVNDLVTVPNSASLGLTGAMTLEAWVKPDAIASMWRTVVIKERSSQLAYALYAGNGSGVPSGHVYTTADRGLAGPKGIARGSWSHLASTWDGSTARLYVNGVQVASSALAAPAVSSTGALRIGGNKIWAEWFKGLIDDVRVYDRALSATEVQSDMNAGSAQASLANAKQKAKAHRKAKAKKHRKAKKHHKAKKHKRVHRTRWL